MLRSRVAVRRRGHGVQRRGAPLQPAADPATLPVTFIVHLLLGSFFSFRGSITFLVPSGRGASERVVAS